MIHPYRKKIDFYTLYVAQTNDERTNELTTTGRNVSSVDQDSTKVLYLLVFMNFVNLCQIDHIS
jgi:hypothetical protein